jgi:hypothetical protein
MGSVRTSGTAPGMQVVTESMLPRGARQEGHGGGKVRGWPHFGQGGALVPPQVPSATIRQQ